MSSTRTSRYAESFTVPVTAANSVWNRATNLPNWPNDNPVTVRVISDVGFHVAWNQAAATTDARVPPECIEFYDVGVNDELNFTRLGTDGTIWITVDKRS